jgi:cell division protease FtsH
MTQQERPTAPPPARQSHARVAPFLVAMLLFAMLFFGPGIIASLKTRDLSYSAFLGDVQQHHVSSVQVGSNGQVTGKLTDGQAFATQAPTWALTTNQLNMVEQFFVVLEVYIGCLISEIITCCMQ